MYRSAAARAGQLLDDLGDQQVEPAGVGGYAVGGQDEEDRRRAVAEVAPAEVGARHARRHARAVKKGSSVDAVMGWHRD